MEISVKNLGVLKEATFTLNDLTIICGKNNTGKTYITYALHGFLSLWRKKLVLAPTLTEIKRLLNKGRIDLNLQREIDAVPSILEQCCKSFTKRLPRIFASRDKYFSQSHFSVKLDQSEIRPRATFERTMRTEEGQVLSLVKEADSLNLTVTLLAEKEDFKIPLISSDHEFKNYESQGLEFIFNKR